MIAELLKLLSSLHTDKKLSEAELREVAKLVASDPELAKSLTEDDRFAEKIIKKMDLDPLAKKVIRRAEMVVFIVALALGALAVVWKTTDSLERRVESTVKERVSDLTNRVDLKLTSTYNEITNGIAARFQEPTMSNLLVSVGSQRLQPIIDAAKTNLHNDINRFTTNLPVELLGSLYSNMAFEEFRASDTNHVQSYQETNGPIRLAIKLSSVPIPNSIQAFLEIESPYTQAKKLPDPVKTYKNVILERIVGPNLDLNRIMLSFQYIKDTRQTNLHTQVQFRGTNLFFNGNLFEVKPP
jgi:hypothetical protein